MGWIEHDYVDGVALANALAADLAQTVDVALATRNGALLALAGGRTPLPAYRELAARWRGHADAARIVVMPTDDRCVPHDHPASNVAELRAIFEDTDVRVEAMTTANGDPERSERYARAMLAEHPAAFDAVVLGMGMDAHTASLFPNARQLAAGLDRTLLLDALRVDPDPLPAEAPFPRISLTLARLLRARALHLVLTGDAKRAVLARAQTNADAVARPVAALLHAPGAQVHIHWSP
ncbi:6-phosphogluconolactonase [Cognatilysobacter lacus]|uniref:6-phosphogluconolactonase n=1 Tax=Cognatilysobacter lacus TaxID=1643323 RepID=A0A5D8Z1J5_9GAMM|nr:6-phosphogluconolactonase [Lysobacter lacus]TZF88426.1 6-phosphogluconolactonase [Lysobacter lacus]